MGDEISWPMVERIVCDSLDDSSVKLAELSLLAGGIVNTTVSVKTTSGHWLVLKVSPHRVNRSHEREARELALLGELGVPVPKVYASRTASLESPHSYLVLEHIDGITLRDAKTLCTPDQLERVQRHLAELVCVMHAKTGDRYGRFEGAPFTDWPAFYKSLVDPVLQEADKLHTLPQKVTKTIHRMHARLDQLLAHGDAPRLCHGDLWAANVLCHAGPDGAWRVAAIIDPEMRFGHAEAELAYMELFQTITPAFKHAYQEQYQLGDAYHKVRKPVYQMYGLINQYQLRGSHEAAALVCSAAEKIGAVM